MSNSIVVYEKYNDIVSYINKAGFKDGIIFKGFVKSEEHNLNILVTEAGTSITVPQLLRQSALKQQLSDLLKCEIFITEAEEMEPIYLKELNDTNSVKLPSVDKNSDKFVSQMQKCFGNKWNFNALPASEQGSLKGKEKPLTTTPSVACKPFYTSEPPKAGYISGVYAYVNAPRL